MFNTIKTAALSALIGLGALAAMPATAQADGLYLNFGGRQDSPASASIRRRCDNRRHRRRRRPPTTAD